MQAQELETASGRVTLNALPLWPGYRFDVVRQVPQGRPVVVLQLLRACGTICDPTITSPARAQFETMFKKGIAKALEKVANSGASGSVPPPTTPTPVTPEAVMLLNVLEIRNATTAIQFALNPSDPVQPMDLVRELQRQLGDRTAPLYAMPGFDSLDPETFGVDISMFVVARACFHSSLSLSPTLSVSPSSLSPPPPLFPLTHSLPLQFQSRRPMPRWT